MNPPAPQNGSSMLFVGCAMFMSAFTILGFIADGCGAGIFSIAVLKSSFGSPISIPQCAFLFVNMYVILVFGFSMLTFGYSSFLHVSLIVFFVSSGVAFLVITFIGSLKLHVCSLIFFLTPSFFVENSYLYTALAKLIFFTIFLARTLVSSINIFSSFSYLSVLHMLNASDSASVGKSLSNSIIILIFCFYSFNFLYPNHIRIISSAPSIPTFAYFDR